MPVDGLTDYSDNEIIPETPLGDIKNIKNRSQPVSTIKKSPRVVIDLNTPTPHKDIPTLATENTGLPAMRFKLSVDTDPKTGQKSPNKLTIVHTDGEKSPSATRDSPSPPPKRSISRNKRIIEDSDDDSDDDANMLQVKKHRAVSKSPILVDSDDSDDEAPVNHKDEFEVQLAVKQLQEMFPNTPIMKLEAVLDTVNGKVAEAITLLLNQQNSTTQPNGNGGNTSVAKATIPPEPKKATKPPPRRRHDSYDSEDDEGDPFEAVDRQRVLDMFRGCTHSQLCRLPGLGARGVEVAMSLRPFESYDDMYQKFDSTKGVTVNAILSCQELLNELAEVDRLMAGCEKITKVMRQKITVNEDTDQTETDNAQPSCLTGTLKSYQLVGLKWLSLIYENKVGGILADEMGLGKTIQAIAYLAYVTEIEQGLYGAHCVICPASTIANWAREFEKWAPNMTVLQYTGPQASRQEIRAAVRQKKTKHAVLLTTYNNVGTASDRSFLAKQKFSVMICDEGHMLKNMGSQRYTQLHKFNARHRVLLTGTPLQNNLLELISLLNFIMPTMFTASYETLERIFKQSRYSLELEEETEFGPEMDIVKRARNIMKPFVLRRLKKDVLGDLPKKTTHIEFCEMEANQKELYADLVNEIREQKESTDTKQIQNVMMQLRKMANHETLHRSHYGDDLCFKLAQRLQIEDEFEGKKVEHIQEELFFMSDFQIHTLCVKYPRLAKYQLDDEVRHSSAKLTWLGEHLPKMKERGDRVLLFSQFTVMLDILEDYLEHVGIGYLRLDGQTAVSERQDLIDEFDENEDILVFLLSTRAGGVGINLTASNTVILHDMDYNPHNDRQAEDRAHRVGQTRPVKVIKLVAKNTIDEAILHLANTKLALDQQMKGDKSGGGNNKADMEILLAESLGLAKLDNSSSK